MPNKSKKKVQSFLGFGNFYQHFICNFSKISKPLFDLTKKDAVWEWSHKCKNAFLMLKEAFISSLVLLMPEFNKPFRVECDTSEKPYYPNRIERKLVSP